MLLDRAFSIGGGVCLLLGATLLFVDVWLEFPEVLFGFLPGGVLSVGFATFLFYTARGARKERRKLLALGDEIKPR